MSDTPEPPKPIATSDIIRLAAALVEQADLYDRQSRYSPKRPSPSAVSPITRMTNGQARMYAYLRLRATMGLAAPTNVECGGAIGGGVHHAGGLIKALAARGLLSVRGMKGIGREIIFLAEPHLVFKPSQRLLVNLHRAAVIRARVEARMREQEKHRRSLLAIAQLDAEREAPAPPPRVGDRVLDESRDGPRRLWPVVEFLRGRGEPLTWVPARARYVITGNYARLTPLDLVRRANIMRRALGADLFPLALADRDAEVAAA